MTTISSFRHLGTVSHGTMREEDLIPAFLDVLDSLNKASADAWREEYADIDSADDWDDCDPETLQWACESLFDKLDDCAPAYCHFGASEGDGSDYGFWPSIDSLEEDARYGEVLKVNDLSEVPANASGHIMHVTDHGNVTLYSADAGILTEIWSVV